jgi:hypothetical protein
MSNFKLGALCPIYVSRAETGFGYFSLYKGYTSDR